MRKRPRTNNHLLGKDPLSCIVRYRLNLEFEIL